MSGWNDIAASADQTIRRTLILTAITVIGVSIAAFDVFHRHAIKRTLKTRKTS